MIDDLLAAADARRAAEEQRELALQAEAARDRLRPQSQSQPSALVKSPPEEPEIDVFA